MSDALVSAVGLKHCGEPEDCSKKATVEAEKDGNATSPTDETYMTTGVGLVEGLTDVVSTSKLFSLCGET